VRFLYTLGSPGVSAWDAGAQPDTRSIDLPRYRVLLLRAIQTVLAPVEQALPGGAVSLSPSLFPAPLLSLQSV